MSCSEREVFLALYEERKCQVLHSKQVFEQCRQDELTVLRQAYQIFRRDFAEIGNTDIFQESLTIASACSQVLRKRFLKPQTISLNHAGGYSCNNNYSKKALMLLIPMEQIHGCRVMHARNIREIRLVELPKYSVDLYSPETSTEFPARTSGTLRCWAGRLWLNGMKEPCPD
jgi:hypothetical protein